MKTAGRMSKKLIISIVAAVVAVLFVTGIAIGVNITNQNSQNYDPSVALSKTTKWCTPGDYTKAQIELTGTGVGKGIDEIPKILYIGTLCSAHNLNTERAIASLDGAAKVGDVDYWLYNGDQNITERGKRQDFHGSMAKGETVDGQHSDIRTKMDDCFTTANHKTLGKFIDCIYNNVHKNEATGKYNYNCIILEFDRTVLAHQYGTNNNKKSQNEAAVASIMSDFYKNNAVVWFIKPNQVTQDDKDKAKKDGRPIPSDEPTPYITTADFFRYNDSHGWNDWQKLDYDPDLQPLDPDLHQYKAYKALCAPDYYDDSRDDHNVNPNNQINYYQDISVIKTQIENSVRAIYRYNLTFKDSIQITQGCEYIPEQDDPDKILEGTHFEISDDNVTFIPVPKDKDEKTHTHTITYDPSTGLVTGEYQELLFRKYVKLVVMFKTPDSEGKDFTKNSATGNPNNGPGNVEMKMVDEKTPLSGDAQIEHGKELQWPVDIKYHVEKKEEGRNPQDDCTVTLGDKDKGIEAKEIHKDGEEEKQLMTNHPQSDLQGSIAKPGPGWKFINWTDDNDGDKEVSKNPEWKAPYDSENERQMPGSYTAHFTFEGGISKATDHTSAVGGDTIEYTINVANGGDATAEGVVVTDDLGKYLSILDVDNCEAVDGNFDKTTGIATWTKDVPTEVTLKIKLKDTLTEAQCAAFSNKIENVSSAKFGSQTVTHDPVNTTIAPRDVAVEYKYTRIEGVGVKAPDGVTPPKGSDTEKYGSTYTIEDQENIPDGYEFVGWFNNEECTDKIATPTIELIKDRTTLWGKWEHTASVVKAVDKSTTVAGDTLTYTVTVSNSSSKQITIPFVVDEVNDPNLENIVPAEGEGGVLTGSTITWTNVEVPANGETPLHFTAKVKESTTQGTVIKNKAKIVIGSNDVWSDYATTTIDAKIGFKKEISDITPTAGDKVTYYLKVTNYSTAEISGVSVVDTPIDANLTVDESSITKGGSYDSGTRTITWSSVKVDGSQTKTLSFDATINTAIYTPDTNIVNPAKASYMAQEIPDKVTVPVTRLTGKVTYHFMPERPSGAKPPSDSYPPTPYGEKVEVQPQNPLYGGWKFEGWYETEECEGTPINPGSEVIIKEPEKKLWGKWTPVASMTKDAQQKGESKDSFVAGQIFDYVITVTNPTVGVAIEGLTIEDVLNPNLEYKGGATKYEDGKVIIEGVNVPAATDASHPGTATVKFQVLGKIGSKEDLVIPNKATTNVYGKDLEASKQVTVTPKKIKVFYHYKPKSFVPDEAQLPCEVDEINYGKDYYTKSQTAVPGYEFVGWYKNDSKCEGEIFTHEVLTADETHMYGYWKVKTDIKKQVWQKSVEAGQTINYELDVTNNSAGDLYNLKVTDGPLNDLFVSVDASPDGGSYGEENRTITWSINELKSGATKTLRFSATLTKDVKEPITITNSAFLHLEKERVPIISNEVTTDVSRKPVTVEYQYVKGPTPNPVTKPRETRTLYYGDLYTALSQEPVAGWIFDGWYKEYSCDTKFDPNTPLENDHTILYGKWSLKAGIEKTVSKGSVTAGEEFTYTITVSNPTNQEITGLKVNDELDENIQWVDKGTGEQYDSENHVVYWDDVTVAAQGKTIVSFVAKASLGIQEQTTLPNHAYTLVAGKQIDAYKDVVVNPKLVTVEYQYKPGSFVPKEALSQLPHRDDTVIYNTEYNPDTAVARPVVPGYKFNAWCSDSDCKTPYQVHPLQADKTIIYGEWQVATDLVKTVEESQTSPVSAGTDLHYHVSITNNSDDDLSNIDITDSIDANIKEVKDYAPASYTDGTLTWHIDNLAKGDTVNYTFTATIKKDVNPDTVIVNQAKTAIPSKEILSDQTKNPVSQLFGDVLYHHVTPVPEDAKLPGDNGWQKHIAYGTDHVALDQEPVPGYKFSGWYTDETFSTLYTGSKIMIPLTELWGKFEKVSSITKSVDETEITAGGSLTYTITVENNSDYPMVNEVEDTFDSKLIKIKSNPSASDVEGNKLTWKNVYVPAHDSTSITVTASTDQSTEGSISNQAITYIGGNEEKSNTVNTTINPFMVNVNYHYTGEITPPGMHPPKDIPKQHYGDVYNPQPKDKAAGYVFNGWYEDEALTIPYTGRKLYKDLDLWGKWSEGVRVEKTAQLGEKTSVDAGESVPYNITVHNDSDVDMTVTITDIIEANFETVVIVSGGGGYNTKTRTVSYDPYVIPAKSSDIVSFTAKTKLDVDHTRPEVRNTAVAHIDQGEHPEKVVESPEVVTPVNLKQGTVDYAWDGPVPSGEKLPTEQDPFYYGHEYTAQYPRVYPGYQFDGWFEKNEQGQEVPYVDGTKIMKPETHLIGHWSNKTEIHKANTPEGTVNAGDIIEYTITAKNTTDQPIKDALITDDVQSDFIASSVTPKDDGKFDGKQITWQKDIDANSEVKVRFSAQTNEAAAEDITYKNQAILTVSGHSISSEEVTNDAKRLFKSIVINKIWSDGEPRHDKKSEAGDYEFVNVQLYRNNVAYGDLIKLGPNDKWKDSNWAKLIENLPVYDSKGIEYQYTIKEFTQDGTSPVSDVYTHKLADGNTAEYTPSYSYSKSAATVTNTYNVKPDDLSLEKSGDKKTAKPGEDITYTITAKYGPSSGSAANVIIEDKLPDGLIYKSSDPEGSYDPSTGKVTWIIDSIEGGSSKAITLVCSVPSDAKTKSYSNTASIIAYGTLPPEEKVSKDELTPTPLKSVGCKITKSIVRNAGTEQEQDYLSTNETIGGDAMLRYYLFKYVAPELEEPVVTDELPYGLVPPKDGEYDDYSLTSSYNVDKKRYTVTMTLKNPLKDDRTPVNLPVTIDSTIDKHLVMVSPAKLTSVYKPSEAEREDLKAASNETKMVVDVPTPLPTPIPVPKPVVTDVKEITVVKTWSDGALAHIADSVKVSLYADGELKYTQDLNTGNQWTYTWEEMPIKTDAGNPIKYTLKEETQVDGYRASIQESEDGDFTVVNEKIVPPANPEQPAGSGLTQTLDDKTLIMIVCFFVFGACISGFALRVHRRRHM